jgi:hypothetical protein
MIAPFFYGWSVSGKKAEASALTFGGQLVANSGFKPSKVQLFRHSYGDVIEVTVG